MNIRSIFQLIKIILQKAKTPDNSVSRARNNNFFAPSINTS
ncbi:hypothetical protein NEOC65_000673 [Neochlamydia sp. AcF65]|nr:hypothetical protein [Neochlamydia sp. AcF65]